MDKDQKHLAEVILSDRAKRLRKCMTYMMDLFKLDSDQLKYELNDDGSISITIDADSKYCQTISDTLDITNPKGDDG
jgi:hypothetical protein